MAGVMSTIDRDPDIVICKCPLNSFIAGWASPSVRSRQAVAGHTDLYAYWAVPDCLSMQLRAPLL